MSALVVAYIEQLAEGVEPRPDSEEAKAYRAWSWAYEQMRRIKIELGV